MDAREDPDRHGPQESHSSDGAAADPGGGLDGILQLCVTGHALELPYVLHDRQYALLEPVLWQTQVRPAPAYSNDVLRDFWQADLR